MDMRFLERVFVNSSPWNLFTKQLLYRPFLKKLKEKPTKIIEVGCGVGKTTVMIANRFPQAEITAIDFDPVQIKKAKARNKNPRIRFEHADATKLPFGKTSFDAVFAFMALHHIEDYKQCLKECKRVLIPGSKLYVIDLGKVSIHQLGNLVPAPHVFSRKEVAQSVKDAGFMNVESGGNEVRFFVIGQKPNFEKKVK